MKASFTICNAKYYFDVIFCHQAQAKFSLERAKEVISWVEAVLDRRVLNDGIRDQLDFAAILKDGVVLCE